MTETLLNNAKAFEQAADALEAEATRKPRFANALRLAAEHNRRHAAALRQQAERHAA